MEREHLKYLDELLITHQMLLDNVGSEADAEDLIHSIKIIKDQIIANEK